MWRTYDCKRRVPFPIRTQSGCTDMKLGHGAQVGVYSHDGAQLLGTGLSGPVRVLANNDVPTGAAYINLDIPIL